MLTEGFLETRRACVYISCIREEGEEEGWRVVELGTQIEALHFDLNLWSTDSIALYYEYDEFMDCLSGI